jgi:hypothetical protein
MILQYESKKRTFALITGRHGGSSDVDVYVSNTRGDFDPAPVDDANNKPDEDDGFGFHPQTT